MDHVTAESFARLDLALVFHISITEAEGCETEVRHKLT